jgi:hypothetical protein
MLTDVVSLRGITLEGGPWTPYSEAARRRDADRSSIFVTVCDIATRSLISKILRYKKKFLGRALIKPIKVGDINLIPGDRLEPSLTLRDVADFEALENFPFQVVFWRMFGEDRLLHDSPLFLVPGLGIDTHGADTLHDWALGPLEKFIPFALWFLIGTELYQPAIDFLSTEDCANIALMQIKKRLWEHYRIKRGDPRFRKKGSQIWNLTLKMLGKKSDPSISVKAAEAKGLLEFVVNLLETDVPKLSARHKERGLLLLACGKAAWRVEVALRGNQSLTLAPEERQQLLNDYTQHVVLFTRAGGSLIPKHHKIFHLILDVSWKGSPSLYATFRDESLNGIIAGIAKSCHRNRFGEVIHFKFSALQTLAGNAATQMH